MARIKRRITSRDLRRSAYGYRIRLLNEVKRLALQSRRAKSCKTAYKSLSKAMAIVDQHNLWAKADIKRLNRAMERAMSCKVPRPGRAR